MIAGEQQTAQTVTCDYGGSLSLAKGRSVRLARIEGGREGVENRAGNAMARDETWPFTVRRR